MTDRDDITPPVAKHQDEERSINKPMHGPRRGFMVPVLATLAFVAVVALLYWLGLTFLVPAE